MKAKLAGSITALLLTVSGCTGGSDAGNDGSILPPPASVLGGLWSGGLWWDPKDGFPGGARNVRLLVAETGEFRLVLYPDVDQYLVSENEQIFGTFNIDGRDISTMRDTVWVAPVNATGLDWGTFGMSGDFEAGESISGTFLAIWPYSSEERVGTLSLNYHSLYESPSSLDILQGTYTTTEESLTIDDQGAIFYQSSVTGCTGNGTAEIIDPDFNMYRVKIVVNACTGNAEIRNGLTFTGLANIGENNDISGGFLNSTLEVAISALIPGPFDSAYVGWNLRAHKN